MDVEVKISSEEKSNRGFPKKGRLLMKYATLMAEMRIVLSIAILVPCTFFMTGCAMVMYKGEELPPDKVATISSNGVFIRTVDGEKAYGNGMFLPSKLILAPGEHEVGLSLYLQDNVLNYYSGIEYITFSADAGHNYSARVYWGSSSWTPLIFDLQTKETVHCKKVKRTNKEL
jgi:hypothetical protein